MHLVVEVSKTADGCSAVLAIATSPSQCEPEVTRDGSPMALATAMQVHVHRQHPICQLTQHGRAPQGQLCAQQLLPDVVSLPVDIRLDVLVAGEALGAKVYVTPVGR